MPPRQGRVNSGSPDFLWVHRTPDSERLSASRQERDELRAITSHARQWRAALRRQQRLYTAQSEATRAQSIVGWTWQGDVSEASSTETSAAPSPAPLNQITGGSLDPFMYLETPEDAWWSHNAFQYAVERWLPCVFRTIDVLDDALASSAPSLATINRIIQGCLADRMHMFSLLAASTGFLKYIRRTQLDRHDSPEYCTAKAIQYLRHHLAGNPQVDELLIFDLKALSTFERYVNNFEGARTHLRMASHLVQSLGGLEILELPLRLLYWLWDLLVACVMGEAPLMPLTLDPGQLSCEDMQGDIIPELTRSGIVPSGSSLVRYTAIFHHDLLTLVSDTVQWFQVQQHNYLHNFSRSQTEKWSLRRSYALSHRLLSSSTNFASETQHLEDMSFNLTECVKQSCLAVISDMEGMRPSMAGSLASTNLSQSSWLHIDRLRRSLTEIMQSDDDWSDHEEIMLWMACLGAQKTRENQDRDWFLDIASWIARKRGVSSRDDLIQLMAGYLHLCEPTGAPSIVGLEAILGEERLNP